MNSLITLVYFVVLIVVIVLVDLKFLRDDLQKRLIINIIIV